MVIKLKLYFIASKEFYIFGKFSFSMELKLTAHKYLRTKEEVCSFIVCVQYKQQWKFACYWAAQLSFSICPDCWTQLYIQYKSPQDITVNFV